MRHTLVAVLIFVSVIANGQFHLKITCNPANDGQVNSRWLNNYVITYTNDNWKHSFLIYRQATYQGFDNNGVTYYTSFWQPCTFQTQEEAYEVAHNFTSLYSVGKHLSSEYKKHLQLDSQYREIIKKLNFVQTKSQNCSKDIILK